MLGGRIGLSATAELVVELDASAALTALGNDLFPDSGLLDVGLGSNKTLVIDLGTLLGGAYGAGGTLNWGSSNALNNLPPNTNLLTNLLAAPPSGEDSTVTRLAKELGNIGKNILDVLRPLLKVKLTLNVKAHLLTSTVDAATVELYSGTSDTGTTPASLADLLSGNFHLHVTAMSNVPGVGDLLSLLGTALVGTTVVNAVKAIGTTLDGLLKDLVLTGPVMTLITTLTDTVDQLLTGLFVNPGVLSLTANAQNHPEAACVPPTGAGAAPTDWDTLVSGEYDVAALRLGVVGAVTTKLVTLYLARGAVGPISATASPSNP